MDFPVLAHERFFKEFPHCPRFVPWQLMTPHEAQAKRNHYQTLNRLAQRGGLCPSEIYAVVNDKSWERIDDEASVAFLINLVEGAGKGAP